MKRNLEPFNINKLISWFTSIVNKTEGELNNKLLKMKCSNGKFIYMKERLFTHCSKFKHFFLHGPPYTNWLIILL